jgi:hypothetical protein
LSQQPLPLLLLQPKLLLLLLLLLHQMLLLLLLLQHQMLLLLLLHHVHLRRHATPHKRTARSHGPCRAQQRLLHTHHRGDAKRRPSSNDTGSQCQPCNAAAWGRRRPQYAHASHRATHGYVRPHPELQRVWVLAEQGGRHWQRQRPPGPAPARLR